MDVDPPPSPGGSREPDFLPGLELSQGFYQEAVRPLLEKRFPGLVHSAALLGRGSDVLGFDTPQSMDHHWGPRVDLFLNPDDHDRYAAEIMEFLRRSLPYEVRGFPTHFANPEIDGGQLQRIDSGPVSHGVRVFTLQSFFHEYLNYMPGSPPTVVEWLTFPEQRLRTIRSGRVFHDDLGSLTRVREALKYYPRDVWLYRMAAGWRRISQEEAFLGRTGDVGDELGSRLVGARLALDLMRLSFLIARQYAPYIKWLGTAFRQLPGADQLMPDLMRLLEASHWRQREAFLGRVFTHVAERHNALQITPPLPARVSRFHNRPYRVIHAQRFVEALREEIRDPDVLALPPYLGSVDQFSDSTDVLDTEGNEFHPVLAQLYRRASTALNQAGGAAGNPGGTGA